MSLLSLTVSEDDWKHAHERQVFLPMNCTTDAKPV
jgi:hypothetical protein